MLLRILGVPTDRRAAAKLIAAGLAALLLASHAGADENGGGAVDAARIAGPLHQPAATSVIPIQQATTQQHIESLIRQLGSPQFTARRAAANELRQIGPEAFDLLHAASDDSDPEVAAAARYLLRQITVRWVQSDDAPAVRRLLRDFSAQGDEARLRVVRELSRLGDGEGIAALCRIARFDRSPLVSRTAALAVIRPGDRSVLRTTVDPELVERELGNSTRVPAVWLRHYLLQLRDPAASLAAWQRLIDEETARLDAGATETSKEIAIGLLWNLAELQHRLDDAPAMLATVDHLASLDPDALEPTAISLLSWLIEHQSWSVLDEFLSRHQPQLERSKRPLYYAALARARQGQSELAEQLAEQAAQLDSQGTLEGFIAARDMEEQGQFTWAVREYRRAIDDGRLASQEGIVARIHLSGLLHDYEQDREAADVLEPLVNAFRGDGHVAQLYAELSRLYRGVLYLPETKAVSANYHYYRACQHRAEQHHEREQQALKLAIEFDPTNADVLIAMYRVPDADDEWRENTRRRIRELSRRFQQQIDEEPTRATHYNQWAWLVSNTEGDYQKAIRYSHRSLELNTGGDTAAASYLDTLGRCYYAVGDLENAIKYQRQAIEKAGYMQVMHRQLALFEQALAETEGQGAGGEGQGARDAE